MTRDMPAAGADRKPRVDATRRTALTIPSLASRSTGAHMRRQGETLPRRYRVNEVSLPHASSHMRRIRALGGERRRLANKGGATRPTPLVLCDGRRLCCSGQIACLSRGRGRRQPLRHAAQDANGPGRRSEPCWTSHLSGSIRIW